jgi:hypothetical protein
LPALAVPGLPTGGGVEGLVVETARMDRSGRVSARPLLRALGWGPGHRIDIAVVGGVLPVGSVATGQQVVGGRGELSLPAAADVRHHTGPAGTAGRLPVARVLMVHPIAVVARLLSDWYTTLTAGSDGG